MSPLATFLIGWLIGTVGTFAGMVVVFNQMLKSEGGGAFIITDDREVVEVGKLAEVLRVNGIPKRELNARANASN